MVSALPPSPPIVFVSWDSASCLQVKTLIALQDLTWLLRYTTTVRSDYSNFLSRKSTGSGTDVKRSSSACLHTPASHAKGVSNYSWHCSRSTDDGHASARRENKPDDSGSRSYDQSPQGLAANHQQAHTTTYQVLSTQQSSSYHKLLCAGVRL